MAKKLNNDTLSTANIMRVCNTKSWQEFINTPKQTIQNTTIADITSAIKNLSRYDNLTSNKNGFNVNINIRDDDYER